jgi:hypothetical protein
MLVYTAVMRSAAGESDGDAKKAAEQRSKFTNRFKGEGNSYAMNWNDCELPAVVGKRGSDFTSCWIQFNYDHS